MRQMSYQINDLRRCEMHELHRRARTSKSVVVTTRIALGFAMLKADIPMPSHKVLVILPDIMSSLVILIKGQIFKQL